MACKTFSMCTDANRSMSDQRSKTVAHFGRSNPPPELSQSVYVMHTKVSFPKVKLAKQLSVGKGAVLACLSFLFKSKATSLKLFYFKEHGEFQKVHHDTPDTFMYAAVSPQKQQIMLH